MEITIDRMRNSLRLATRLRDRTQIERRLRQVAQQPLTDCLEAELERRFGSDPRVILCRDLTVSLGFESSRMANEGECARRWAIAIADEITRSVSRADDKACPDGVLVFDNEAAYLAAFLYDRLHDETSRRWWHPDSLKLEDASIDMATLVERVFTTTSVEREALLDAIDDLRVKDRRVDSDSSLQLRELIAARPAEVLPGRPDERTSRPSRQAAHPDQADRSLSAVLAMFDRETLRQWLAIVSSDAESMPAAGPLRTARVSDEDRNPTDIKDALEALLTTRSIDDVLSTLVTAERAVKGADFRPHETGDAAEKHENDVLAVALTMIEELGLARTPLTTRKPDITTATPVRPARGQRPFHHILDGKIEDHNPAAAIMRALRWLDDRGSIHPFSKDDVDGRLAAWRPNPAALTIDRSALRDALMSLPSCRDGHLADVARYEGPADHSKASDISSSAKQDLYTIARQIVERLGLRQVTDVRPNNDSTHTSSRRAATLNGVSATVRGFEATGPQDDTQRLLRLLFDLGQTGQLSLSSDADAHVDEDAIERAVPAYVDQKTFRLGLRSLIEDLRSQVVSGGLPGARDRNAIDPQDDGIHDRPEDMATLTKVAETLIACLQDLDLTPPRERPSSLALALVLHSVLAAKAPDLTEKEATRSLISDVVQTIGTSKATTATASLPSIPSIGPGPSSVARLGSLGADLLREVERRVNRTTNHAPVASLNLRSAGIFRLIRSVLDLHFLSAARQVGVVSDASEAAVALAPLFSRLAAIDPFSSVEPEPVIAHVTGLEDGITEAELITAWRTLPTAKARELQQAMFLRLAGQRIISGEGLAVRRSTDSAGRDVLIACVDDPVIWPIGAWTDGDAESFVESWIETWITAFGAPPAYLRLEARLASDWAPPSSVELIRRADFENDDVEIGRAFDALGADRRLSPDVDLTLSIAAVNLLRIWARWLKGFEAASVPFLLDSFVRLDGRLTMPDETTLSIDIDPGPLDIVLQLSGYDDPIEAVPWLNGRTIIFRSADGRP